MFRTDVFKRERQPAASDRSHVYLFFFPQQKLKCAQDLQRSPALACVLHSFNQGHRLPLITEKRVGIETTNAAVELVLSEVRPPTQELQQEVLLRTSVH